LHFLLSFPVIHAHSLKSLFNYHTTHDLSVDTITPTLVRFTALPHRLSRFHFLFINLLVEVTGGAVRRLWEAQSLRLAAVSSLYLAFLQ